MSAIATAPPSCLGGWTAGGSRLCGGAPQVGRGAHLRLAGPVSSPQQGLRVPAGDLRGGDLPGHDPDPDAPPRWQVIPFQTPSKLVVLDRRVVRNGSGRNRRRERDRAQAEEVKDELRQGDAELREDR